MPQICLKCLTDDALCKLAADTATKAKCDYCGKSRRGITMRDLAALVGGTLQAHYHIGAINPPTYEQEGDPLVLLLQEDIGFDYEPAKDLVAALEDWDPADPRDEDPFFDSTLSYCKTAWSPPNYFHSWEYFSRRIKHERRFFDDSARTELARILGEQGSPEGRELPVIEIGPGSRIPEIYRARNAESQHAARKILADPADQLGPPSPEIATAGRMNAAGISVFYGAVSEDTAIAEVRPSVGGLVVVGSFEVRRTLRLLDLTQLGVFFAGSMFHEDYEDRSARGGFLEEFHSLIARPVQPRDELLEYIPTQATAEYIANVLGSDGILYASAQVGAVPDAPEPSAYVHVHKLSDEELAQHNVVLFGKTVPVRESADSTEDRDGDSASAALVIKPQSVRAVTIRGMSYMHKWTYVSPEIEESGPESLEEAAQVISDDDLPF